MKIIMSIATLEESNKQLSAALNVTPVSTTDTALTLCSESAGLKNVRYTMVETEAGTELMLEVNDSVILKYIGVYVKVIKFVMPFVEPVKALFGTLKDDFNDIIATLSERK